MLKLRQSRVDTFLVVKRIHDENTTVHDSSERLRVACVVAALSRALDLSTGQPAGHSIRSCVLGMRIADELGMREERSNELFYALLLKDCGCSANASKTFHVLGSDDIKAKRDVKTTDWTRISWETLQYALAHTPPANLSLKGRAPFFGLRSRRRPTRKK